MTDTRTPEQRRRIMAAVRSANTGPELRLRRALYAAGIRGWRCHYKPAPGRPDLAWPALRVAVFVDGAFWHGHRSRHKPGRSGSYWDEKIARNIERDREADAALESDGWTVVRVWDFEVARDVERVVERVSAALCGRADDSAGWQRRLRRSKRAHERVETAPASQGARAEAETGSFARNLREARMRAGMSRHQLALASGVDENTIRLYERGTREPRLGTLVALARSLGEAPEALMRGLQRPNAT